MKLRFFILAAALAALTLSVPVCAAESDVPTAPGDRTVITAADVGDGGTDIDDLGSGSDPVSPDPAGGTETPNTPSGGGGSGSSGGGSASPFDPGTAAPDTPVSPDARPSARFTDVNAGAWYADAVDFVVSNGIMNGVSETSFAPNAPCTRAMVVTMVWRMAGAPAVDDPMPYTDVPEGRWYTEAIRWAASTGAVNGTSEDTFAPDAPVTREQLAAILYRYAQARGKGFTGAWMFPLDYSDAADVSRWADEAMHWMTMHGVITGMGDGTLAPKANATRAQIATMFMRFCEEMAK